jgi:hypothetical protein
MEELGMWVTNNRDFCGMGIKDPKGKQWSAYVQGPSAKDCAEQRKKVPVSDRRRRE